MTTAAPAKTAPSRKKKGNSTLAKRLKRCWPFYIMALPAIIYFVINNYIPMSGLILAFEHYTVSGGIFGSEKVGLQNFKFLFTSADSWIMIRNTLLYNLAFIVLGTVIAILTAYFLHELKSNMSRKVACSEGAAMGLNWSFAPIVDIDMEFHNPITNTRTFGSDVERVIACGSRYMDAADEENVAVSIKHFPGDGVDERDQHILTSVNSLSAERWMETYGKVYKTLIDKGAKTVMVGHIAQPAWTKKLNPDATRKETLLPATLNPAILQGLLRGELGFNGLISTDATPMVGFTSAMPRREAVPRAIAAGCDMILFNKSLDEDYQYLLDGVEKGLVSEKRLDEAVTRILATKASLGLPEKKAAGSIVPGPEALSVVGCEEHKRWANECADRSVTLVRDTQNLLPLSTAKFKRVYLNVIQKNTDPADPLVRQWKALFEHEGFEVTVRDRRTTIEPADFSNPNPSPEKQAMLYEMYRGVEEMKKNYDLYVYVCNMQNASNKPF